MRKQLILVVVLTIFLLNTPSLFGFVKLANASPLSTSEQDAVITGEPDISSSGSTYIIGPLGFYWNQIIQFCQSLGVSADFDGFSQVIEKVWLPLNLRLIIVWVPGWGAGQPRANTTTTNIVFDKTFDDFLSACDKYGISVVFQWAKAWSFTSPTGWDRDVYNQFPELAGLSKTGTAYTPETTPGDLNMFMIDDPLYFIQLKEDLKQLYEYYGRHKSWIGLGQFKGDFQYYAGKGGTSRPIYSYPSFVNYFNSKYFKRIVDIDTGLHYSDRTKCKLYETFEPTIVFEYGRWQAVMSVVFSGVYGGTGVSGRVAGFKFMAPENLDGFKIMWYGQIKGSPPTPLIIELYKNKGPYGQGEQPDNLGNPLESYSINVGSPGWQGPITFTTRLAKGDFYWIIFQTSGGDANNCYQMYYRNFKYDESTFKFSYRGYTTDWWSFKGSAILKIQDKDGNDVKIYPFQKNVIKTNSGSDLTQTFTTPDHKITFNSVMMLFSDRISDSNVPTTVDITDSSSNVLASGILSQERLKGFPYNAFVAIPLDRRITLEPSSRYNVVLRAMPSGRVGWQWHALQTDPASAGFEGQPETFIFKLADMDVVLDDFMHVGGQELLEPLGKETGTAGVTDTEWYASGFVPTKSAPLSQISLYISEIYGSPSGLTVSLYSGDETKPISPLESKTVTPAIGWVDVVGWAQTLTAGNYYWIVLKSAGGAGYRPARIVNPYIWINKRSTDRGNTWGYQVEVGDLVMEVITTQERIGTSVQARNSLQVTNTKWVAQSFAVSTDTIIKGVLLWTTKPDNDPGSDLIVEIRSDGGGDAPSSTVLTSGKLYNKDHNYRGLNYVQFYPPIKLTAGAKYWIVTRTPQFFQNPNYPPMLEIPTYIFRYPQFSYGGTTYHTKYSTNSGFSWSLPNGEEGDIIFAVVKDPSLTNAYTLQNLVETDLDIYHCFSSPNPPEPLRGWNTYLNLHVDKIQKDMMEWLEGYSGRRWITITPNNYRIAEEAGAQRYAYTAEWITGPLPGQGPPEDKQIRNRAIVKVQSVLKQSNLGFWPGGSLGHTYDNTGAITAEQIGFDYRMTLPLSARAVSVFDMDPAHVMEIGGDSGHTTHAGLQYWSKKYGEILGRMKYYGGYFGHEKQAVKALFVGDLDVGITPQFFTPALDITLEGFQDFEGDFNLTKYEDFSQFNVIVGFSSRPSLSDLTVNAQQRIKNFVYNGGGLVCFGGYPAWANEIFANAQIIPIDHAINKPYTSSDFIDSRPQISISNYGSGRGVLVKTKKGWDRIGMPDPNPYWPFGGAPRDSILVLTTNAIFYAAKKESMIPAWWYTQYKDFQSWHEQVWYSICGKPGSPILLWLSNNNVTTNFEIHLNASFYGIDSAGWIAIDVQNWEVVTQGSGTDIKINTTIPAKSWKPIYIMSAATNLYDLYSNIFIKSRSISAGKATYILQGPYKQTSWLVIRSVMTPSSVIANNTGALPQYTSLSVLNANSALNGWYYDPTNKLLYIKFKATSTVEIEVLAEEVSYLFESGFENQFNDWDGIEKRNNAYVQTGTQSDGFPIHHGTYSMKSASAAVAGSQSWAYKRFQHVEEVYIRAYVYFPKFWTYPNAWDNGNPAWWIYFMVLSPEYPIPYSRNNKLMVTQLRAMYFTADKAGKEGWYFQGTSYDAPSGDRIYLPNPNYPNQWTLSPNKWYCVELYNKLASSYGANDGIWKLWVDGQLYYDFTNLNNRDQDYPWLGAIMVGNYEVPPSTNGWDEPFPTIYVDCLKVGTEYIGPEPGGPEPPPVTHILSVSSSPIAGISFTVDGTQRTTDWSGTLTEGVHTIVMPSSVTVGGTTYNFVRWEDGSTIPTRTINLTSDMTITAYYEATSQPPTKYTLNILSEPITNVKMTVDGATEIYTPGSVTLTVGSHTVSAQSSVTRNGEAYVFDHWENDETGTSRTISLTADKTITATYKLSLPSGETFGKTTIGAITNLLMPGQLRATKFTAPRTGTLNSVTIYFGNVGNYISGQPSPTKFIVAVYSEDLRLLGQSDPTTIIANSWNTGTLISPVAIEAGKVYWFAFMIDGAGAWVSGVNEPWVEIKFDEPGEVSSQTIEQIRVSWGSMPNPFPAVGAAYRDRAYSIYGAYTPTQPPPPPTHTLNIYSYPITGVSFTLDGTSQVTPYTTPMYEGAHTITMPDSTVIGGTSYNFKNWEDGSTNPTRVINLVSDTSVTAYYEVVVTLPSTHALSVSSSPVTGVSFTVDGTKRVTPWSGTLAEGTHTISMPSSVTISGTTYNFVNWEDGSTSPTRTINLTTDMKLTAYYQVYSPPPPPPPSTHTLSVNSSPISGVSFTLDGVSRTTPYSATLNEGTYIVAMPSSTTTGGRSYNFKNWEDGSTNPTRVINLVSYTSVTAYYEEVVTPPSTHVLSVSSSPVTGVSFTVDGTKRVTPWSGTLIEGTHTVVMPSSFTVGGVTYNFKSWEDASTSRTRTINLLADITITTYYEVAPSHPSPPSSPPHPSPYPPANHALNLANPSIGMRGCLAAKRAYIFQVNVSDPDGVSNLNYVDLILDPAGQAIKVRWTEGTDAWSEENDPSDYIYLGECWKSISDDRVTLNFAIVFRWTYPDEKLHSVRLYSLNDNDLSDTDDFTDVYYVENDLAIQTPSVSDDRVNPCQTITLSGNIYYEGTSIPSPDDDYQVKAKLSGIQKGPTDTTLTSGHYTITIPAEQTVGSYTYQVSCNHNASAVDTPPVIVDKLMVSISAGAHEVDVGTRVDFTLTITRQYDYTNVASFSITITRNGATWLTLTDPTFNDTLPKPGHCTYSTESIKDNTYGLTAFETNSLTISWRQKIVNIVVVNIAIQAKDQATNTPISGASVYIKNETWTSETKYTNASGWANFAIVEIGTYTIVGEAKGYATALDTVSVTTDITYTLLVSKRALQLAAMPIMSPDFSLILMAASAFSAFSALSYFVFQRRSRR